jgi:hypothetical protein
MTRRFKATRLFPMRVPFCFKLAGIKTFLHSVIQANACFFVEMSVTDYQIYVFIERVDICGLAPLSSKSAN